MQVTDVTASLEQLLEHANWVRRLAGGLVAGPHDADDLVQEVWQATLANKPGTIESPRGWLAGAVRNVANMRRRSAERRLQRERQVADRSHAPSTADLVVDQELRTDLIRRVDLLPEGERQVVLLRFWRNLPPREVAKQLGIPVNTVRSRTARALERLRTQLDEQHGDRRTWCLMLVPLLDEEVLRAAAVAPAATGVKATIVAAAAMMVLTVGGYTAYQHFFVYSPPDFSSSEPVTALLDSVVAPSVTAANASAPAQRVAAPRLATTTLTGQVVDLEGRPIAGAFVHREDEDWFRAWIRYGKITAEEWSTTTDAEGNFTLPPSAFRFMPPRDTVKIGAVTHDHFVAELGWTECVLGEPARFVMRPSVAAQLVIEVVEKGSNVPVPRFGVSLTSHWGTPKRTDVVSSNDPGRRWLTSVESNDLLQHGVAGNLRRDVRLVVGGKNQLRIEVPGIEPIVEELVVPDQPGTTIPRRYEVDLQSAANTAGFQQLNGKVLDSLTGQPIASAYVELHASVTIDGHPGTRWFRTASRPDGTWTIRYDPSLSPHSLVVRHPGYTHQFFPFAGKDSVELRVLPLASLDLTVTTEGRAQPGVHVLLFCAGSPDRSDRERAVTDASGCAHFERLPAGKVSIYLVPDASAPDEKALDSFNLRIEPGQHKQHTFEFASPDLVTVQGKVFSDASNQVPLAPVFIPLDSDHGWVRARSNSGTAFQAGGMRRGRYLVFLLPITDDYREGPYALAGTIEVNAAISQAVDLELPRGTVTGRLHGIEPSTDLVVVAIPKLPSRSLATDQLLSSPKFASMLGGTVAPDGTFRLTRITDGAHELQLRRGDNVLASRSIEVQGGLADIGDWLLKQ